MYVKCNIFWYVIRGKKGFGTAPDIHAILRFCMILLVGSTIANSKCRVLKKGKKNKHDLNRKISCDLKDVLSPCQFHIYVQCTQVFLGYATCVIYLTVNG